MLTRNSPESEVLVAICERCSLKSYVFPDQLRSTRAKFTRVKIGQYIPSKCCNQQLTSKVTRYEEPGRALRLQNIRKRKTTIDPTQAVKNF